MSRQPAGAGPGAGAGSPGPFGISSGPGRAAAPVVADLITVPPFPPARPGALPRYLIVAAGPAAPAARLAWPCDPAGPDPAESRGPAGRSTTAASTSAAAARP